MALVQPDYSIPESWLCGCAGCAAEDFAAAGACAAHCVERRGNAGERKADRTGQR